MKKKLIIGIAILSLLALFVFAYPGVIYHDMNLEVDNGNVTADYFIGDGSKLTGIPTGSSLWTNDSGTAKYEGDVNITGNLSLGEKCISGDFLTSDTTTGEVSCQTPSGGSSKKTYSWFSLTNNSGYSSGFNYVRLGQTATYDNNSYNIIYDTNTYHFNISETGTYRLTLYGCDMLISPTRTGNVQYRVRVDGSTKLLIDDFNTRLLSVQYDVCCQSDTWVGEINAGSYIDVILFCNQ